MKKICYSIACLFSLLLLSTVHCDEARELTKQEKWQQLAFEVREQADSMKQPIDPKMMDALISLRALGISADGSSLGHLDLDDSFPYPYIGIDLYNVPEIKVLVDELVKGFEDFKENQEIEPNFKLVKEIELAKRKFLQPLYSLLEKFYEDRKVPYGDAIVLKELSLFHPHFASVGAEWQSIRSQEEREAKLLDYQNEMERFVSFLKENFMNEI